MSEAVLDSRLTIGTALHRATALLAQAGIARPQAEARILLERMSGLDRATLIGFPEQQLASEQGDAFDALVARRCAHEPVSRILGRREFWSLSFQVTPATLDPRADSETLVAAVLERLRVRTAALSILDLGTGTGCLLLALLSELPRASGIGVDISVEAVATAAANAEELCLGERAVFRVGDWTDPWARDISARFDVIVSNPPYIESTAIDGLAPEVARYDPRAALDGGADGLQAYRQLIPQSARLLRPGGIMALEIGAGQGSLVRRLASDAGFSILGTAADLAAIERCLLFTR